MTVSAEAGIARPDLAPRWRGKAARPGSAMHEWPDELSSEHRRILIETLIIASQQEVAVMPWQATAFDTAPDIGAKIAIAGSIQDELGHANQWCLALENLGVDSRDVVFGTPPDKYKTVFLEHFPIRDYIEFVLTQAFFDRAGRFWTVDYERHSSYAPMRRVAKKVNFEQAFHVFHGVQWVKYYFEAGGESRARVQELALEHFPHGLQWFGAPDEHKSRKGQLEFRVRGWSNDEMRLKWLQSVSAFTSRLGIKIPVTLSASTGKWESEIPFPMLFDVEKRTWTNKPAEWSDVFAQWKRGGPKKVEIMSKIHNEVWGDALWAA